MTTVSGTKTVSKKGSEGEIPGNMSEITHDLGLSLEAEPTLKDVLYTVNA